MQHPERRPDLLRRGGAAQGRAERVAAVHRGDAQGSRRAHPHRGAGGERDQVGADRADRNGDRVPRQQAGEHRGGHGWARIDLPPGTGCCRVAAESAPAVVRVQSASKVMGDMMGQPAPADNRVFDDPVSPPQDCCPALMFTSHMIPYLSTHWPKVSPHGAFSSGRTMVPPSESFSQ